MESKSPFLLLSWLGQPTPMSPSSDGAQRGESSKKPSNSYATREYPVTSSRFAGSFPFTATPSSKSSRRRATPSSSRITSAASSLATCAAKPASFPTATFASTTANPSCPTTSSRQSKNSLPATQPSLYRRTKSWFENSYLSEQEYPKELPEWRLT